MILKKIQIKNFRCYGDFTLGLDRTTVLIGENNTGKTSVLDALRLCLPFPSIRAYPKIYSSQT
ncbi:MAG: AAA family ATPase [Desulfovibrio sp.]|jgi:putative ATP-dependent endonuclease of OLD family|nr:AAA family ATPase [Desulfovibrio sp.]